MLRAVLQETGGGKEQSNTRGRDLPEGGRTGSLEAARCGGGKPLMRAYLRGVVVLSVGVAWRGAPFVVLLP